jgi:hypothetical protein
MVTSRENRHKNNKIYFWHKDKYIFVVIRTFYITAGIQLLYEQQYNH